LAAVVALVMAMSVSIDRLCLASPLDFDCAWLADIAMDWSDA
jgi:hypothetical protein